MSGLLLLQSIIASGSGLGIEGSIFLIFAVYVCLHQLLARLHQLLALHAGSRSCDWCYFGAIDLRSS